MRGWDESKLPELTSAHPQRPGQRENALSSAQQLLRLMDWWPREMERERDSYAGAHHNTTWNQPGIFIGTTDAEAETPILWPPDVKSWLTGKALDGGKAWRQKAKGVTEDEMVGWRLMDMFYGHEFEQTLGDSEGQGSLVCCSPCGRRVRHDLVTEQQQQCQEVFILLFLRTYHIPGASKPESLRPCPYGSYSADKY